MISDEEIGSPFVRNPAALIAFNQPSLDRYEPMVRPGGLLVVNASIIPRAVVRTDVDVIRVPGNDLAEGLGERKLTNMVLLGALLGGCPSCRWRPVETRSREHLPTRHHHLLPTNSKALQAGAACAAQPAAA